MQMFDETGAVLLNMLRLAAFGAAAELAFEVINGWNKARRPNKKALFAADVGWCLCAAACFFMLLLAYADGSLRLLWFVCAAAGFSLFSRAPGRLARRAFAAFFRLTAKLRRFIFKRILSPAAASAKKILVFFSKPLIFFAGCIKMTLYRLKSGKIRRRIAGRKRKWLRERKKAEKDGERC